MPDRYIVLQEMMIYNVLEVLTFYVMDNMEFQIVTREKYSISK
jgi:hypothetical protein